jgi:tetratricopeptide (TPR) repeat protein
MSHLETHLQDLSTPALDRIETREEQALTLAQQGNLGAAEAIYRDLMTAGSMNPVHYYNLAVLCGINSNSAEMISLLEKALELQPNYAEAYYSLGYAHQIQGNLDTAIHYYEKTIALKPDYAEAHYNLGHARYYQDDLPGAIAACQQAIALKPDYLEAYNNLANALHAQGDLTGAMDAFQKAIALKPEDPGPHTNLSMTLMLAGDYENGWREYEARFQRENDPLDIVRPHAQPPIEQWDGSPLQPGDKLLIVSEQGLGDTLQFMRYVPYLRQQGIDVSLCAQPKLHRLIQVSGIDPNPYSPEQAQQITEGKWISMLSFPRYLGISFQRPLVTDPYITVPPQWIEHWRKVLAPEQRPIIGIHWQGTPERNNMRGRSFPLEYFAPVAQGNVRLLSLQKGYGSEQMDTCSFRDRFVTCQDKIDETWDFVETAAIIANCDLIITSCSGTAHLAGGMGKTTWLLLQKVPEWRWGMDTEDLFWYPSFGLFRQRERGNWAEVFQRVSLALQEFMTQNFPPSTPATLLAPISIGELIDKITILEIKTQHLDGAKLANVHKELHALEDILHNLAITIDPDLVQRLKAVNLRLWDIEEAIRQQEHRQDFGETFIQLARSVYRENDERAAIKREINTRYGSALVEEKSYPSY